MSSLDVLRAQAGDREAFDRILSQVQGPLYSYLLRITGNAAQAEDLLQETFMQIFQKIQWLRDPELFMAWAYRIASRAAFRKIRQNKEDATEELELGSVDVNRDFAMDLERLLPQVSSGSRAVLTLHYLDGFPLDDVAAILEIPIGTVKSRLSYGITSLRKHFAVQ